jgi:serine phosphatase RsbU (regulator of sigma subunit)
VLLDASQLRMHQIISQKVKYLRFSLCICLLMAVVSAIAQETRIDSLTAVLDRTGQDAARVNALNKLAYEVFRSNPDVTLQYSEEAIGLARQLNYQEGLAEAHKNMGLGYYLQSNYTGAFGEWENALRIYELLGDEKGIANIISNRGGIYYTIGDYVNALKDYLVALPLAEKVKDSVRIGTLYTNIGSIYSEQESTLDSAKEYYLRALSLGEANGRMDVIGNSLLNLGELYFNMGQYDSSLHYFEKSRTLITGEIDMAIPLTYIGRNYAEQGMFDVAFEYLNEALELARYEKTDLEVVRALLGFGYAYLKQGDPGKAIERFTEAEAIASKVGLNYELSDAYRGLSEGYAESRDYRNAFKYLTLRNEIDNANLRREAENQTESIFNSYQLERKQDEIEILEQQSQIEQLRTRRQRAITIATGTFGLLILLMAVGLYNRMRFIRRTNEMIKKQRDEIESQRNEIEKARDQIQHQHDMVYEQKELITDSIGYAERIQSALLPPHTVLNGMISDYFILFKPKDIVSGDFYWIKEVQDHLVIVSADCTGHGVPGAFMSMLGITLLNDLIGDRCYNAPSAILEQLRMKIKEMLVQDGHSEEQKDGMDMALVVFDRKNRELHYSGANNPLYIIRHKKLAGDLTERTHSVHENGEFNLFEVKADKQPIGVHWEETSFRNHSLKLKENDAFYLFSDGFIDQFGGKDRKKFKSLNFKKLLLSIHADPMERQKQILEQTFEEWKGDYEQIDDVSVIGIRV